jgi:hypothetical protein
LRACGPIGHPTLGVARFFVSRRTQSRERLMSENAILAALRRMG